MKTLKTAVVTLIAVAIIMPLALLGIAWSGIYDIGADDHHTKPVLALMTMVRNRSIEEHAKNIQVPDLDDPQLLLKGAGQYAAMCTSCHLAPGIENSELRAGMYPLPPNLSEVSVDPKVAFWVIKHGIKMSAMPAWSMSGHDDRTIWSMVAFLQKLPDMSPDEYKAMVAKAPPDEEMESMHSHQHGGNEVHVPSESGMSNMPMEVGGGHGHSHGEEPAALEPGHVGVPDSPSHSPGGESADTPAPEHVDAPGTQPHSHADSPQTGGAEDGHAH